MSAFEKIFCLLRGMLLLACSVLGGLILWIVVTKLIHPTPDNNRAENCVGSVLGVLVGGMLLIPLAKFFIEVLLQCWKSVPSLLPRKNKVTPLPT